MDEHIYLQSNLKCSDKKLLSLEIVRISNDNKDVWLSYQNHFTYLVYHAIPDLDHGNSNAVGVMVDLDLVDSYLVMVRANNKLVVVKLRCLEWISRC